MGKGTMMAILPAFALFMPLQGVMHRNNPFRKHGLLRLRLAMTREVFAMDKDGAHYGREMGLAMTKSKDPPQWRVL